MENENKELETFCESKGVTELKYVGEDKAAKYYVGICKAIDKKIDIRHGYSYGTIWFDGIISGYARTLPARV